MHRYFIKTPWWLKKLLSDYIWNYSKDEPAVYLTFDDGPHPEITPWVLSQLKDYNAKATFFCIGKNVNAYPEIFKMIKEEGHAIGNHTQHHLNAWKTPAHVYEQDIKEAAAVIESNLFRPPYGRILQKNIIGVKRTLGKEAKIIMWDVLSADFDSSFSKEQCLHNVLKNTVAGSVVVFHDSMKAYTNLAYTLPLVLENLNKKGFEFRKISHGA
jgi:peptidoglycan-N-acetylglucosamine deacetylase